MDAHGNDPFDSLAKLCIVSDSQEDLLRCCSFAGDPKSANASFPASQNRHLQPIDIFTASPPESLERREQTASRDAYQPPREQSGGQRPMDVDDPSHQYRPAAVEGGCVRDVATGVDLGKNNDLGFLEVQSTEQTAEIEITGVRRRKVSKSDADGEAESASRRLKLSNEALLVEKLLVNLESSRESKLIEESEPVSEKSGKVDDQKISNGEETDRNKNKEKFGEKKVENSEPEEPSYLEGALNRDPWRHVLPLTDSVDSGTPTSIVMEILKILSQEESEEDKNLAHMSFLEISSRRGMTFPRPCWWPEGFNFSFKKH